MDPFAHFSCNSFRPQCFVYGQVIPPFPDLELSKQRLTLDKRRHENASTDCPAYVFSIHLRMKFLVAQKSNVPASASQLLSTGPVPRWKTCSRGVLDYFVDTHLPRQHVKR